MVRATTYDHLFPAPPTDSATAKSPIRLSPILVLVLELFVLLLVIGICMRTIPPTLENKNQDAGAAQALIRDSLHTANKPFLGSWRGHTGETLLFNRDGSLITVWPASKIQPQESVTKLTWTEADGILRYHQVAFRWSVSKNGKTLTLTPLKQDGSAETDWTFTLQRL